MPYANFSHAFRNSGILFISWCYICSAANRLSLNLINMRCGASSSIKELFSSCYYNNQRSYQQLFSYWLKENVADHHRTSSSTSVDSRFGLFWLSPALHLFTFSNKWLYLSWRCICSEDKITFWYFEDTNSWSSCLCPVCSRKRYI